MIAYTDEIFYQNGEEMKSQNNNLKFFAASNGYTGFRSYFEEVFPTEHFDKLYVLKGGPGTGKSSLMKKLSEKLLGSGCTVEEIYCSSDPHSFDGIIAEKNAKKIGMLDGTAPHARDATHPGAIDTIVNLGDNWDNRWLIASKDKICELNKEKKTAYHTAYHYLSLCGFCHDRIRSLINESKLAKIAKSIANDAAEMNFGSFEKCGPGRLLSSFGRQGRYSLLPLYTDLGEVIMPFDDTLISTFFITELTKILKENNIPTLSFADPLDPDSIDTLHIPALNLTYSSSCGTSEKRDAAELFSTVDNESLRVSRTVYSDCIKEAQRWFSIASDFHFRLEEIYTQTMDFEKNDKIFEQKYSEIMSIIS